jgi:hypothetical protein
MRLDGVLRATPDQQLAAFNSISITGEIVGRSLVVFGVYAVSLIFIRVNVRNTDLLLLFSSLNDGMLTIPRCLQLIPFEWVRNLFFITMGIGDIFALVSALTIRSAYFVSPDYGEQPIVSTQEDPPPNSEYYLYLNDPGSFLIPVVPHYANQLAPSVHSERVLLYPVSISCSQIFLRLRTFFFFFFVLLLTLLSSQPLRVRIRYSDF